jgi:Nif-specific regulatory protein
MFLNETDITSLLFEISQLLNKGNDLQQMLQAILKTLSEYTKVSTVFLTVFNRKTGEIFIDTSYGLSNEEQARGRYKIGEGITGKVIQTGEPVIIKRLSTEPLFLNKTRSRSDLDLEKTSFICVPIKYAQDTFGTLSADFVYDENSNLDNYTKLFAIVAAMISRAVRSRQSAEESLQILQEENQRLHEELNDKFNIKNMIGNSHEMKEVYDLIMRVARSNTTVMIRGESGVGKGLVANALHYNSDRQDQAYIKVNCAALPESVIESELFGHEEGAFTGAIATRQGRFELADGGTIFLDEIGELSLMTQTKLLRVIQDKEFERVGGTKTHKVNVRIITATNQNLEKLMTENKFRQDLYYRLNVFPVHVPPLRERKTDILQLVDHFVEKYGKESNKNVKRVTTNAIDMIMSYHWPGNVRELENCIERAVILSNDGVIHGYHLPPTLQTAEASNTIQQGGLDATLERVEKDLIIDALKLTKGNMSKAAVELGISERIMGLRIRKYGIDSSKYR